MNENSNSASDTHTPEHQQHRVSQLTRASSAHPLVPPTGGCGSVGERQLIFQARELQHALNRRASPQQHEAVGVRT